MKVPLSDYASIDEPLASISVNLIVDPKSLVQIRGDFQRSRSASFLQRTIEDLETSMRRLSSKSARESSRLVLSEQAYGFPRHLN